MAHRKLANLGVAATCVCVWCGVEGGQEEARATTHSYQPETKTLEEVTVPSLASAAESSEEAPASQCAQRTLASLCATTVCRGVLDRMSHTLTLPSWLALRSLWELAGSQATSVTQAEWDLRASLTTEAPVGGGDSEWEWGCVVALRTTGPGIPDAHRLVRVTRGKGEAILGTRDASDHLGASLKGGRLSEGSRCVGGCGGLCHTSVMAVPLRPVVRSHILIEWSCEPVTTVFGVGQATAVIAWE